MNSIISQILTKFQSILANPGQLFTLAIYFGIAILVFHFLLKTASFLFRLILAAAILGAVIWFFF